MTLYGKIQNNSDLIMASRCFKMFTLPGRMSIINLLLEKKGITVTQICEMLNQLQPEVSHNLSLLHEHRILTRKKVGRTVYYSVDEERVKNLLKYAEDLCKS